MLSTTETRARRLTVAGAASYSVGCYQPGLKPPHASSDHQNTSRQSYPKCPSTEECGTYIQWNITQPKKGMK